MSIPKTFDAFRIHDDAGGYRSGIEPIALDDLAARRGRHQDRVLLGQLQGRARRHRQRQDPAPVPAGRRHRRRRPRGRRPPIRRSRKATRCWSPAAGCSETRDGGYAAYARLEAQWTIPLPAGLSLRESMILGTAGFTAALALLRMEREPPDARHWGRSSSPAPPAASVRSRSTSSAAPVSRCTRSAARPSTPDYLTAIGATQVLVARRAGDDTAAGIDALRRRRSTTSAARCSPACSRRPRPTATSPARAGGDARPADDGDALHHPRRVAARRGLGRHRARHPRRRSGSAWPATGSRGTWSASARARRRWTQLPEVFDAMLAGRSFGRTLVTF